MPGTVLLRYKGFITVRQLFEMQSDITAKLLMRPQEELESQQRVLRCKNYYLENNTISKISQFYHQTKNRNTWITTHIWEVRLCVVRIALLHIYFIEQILVCCYLNVQNVICTGSFRPGQVMACWLAC